MKILHEHILKLPANAKIYKQNNYLIILNKQTGSFLINIPQGIQIKKQNNFIYVQSFMNLAVMNSFIILIKNLLKSFNKLYNLRLFLQGIGFRVTLNTNILNLKIGFSHPYLHINKSNIKYTTYKNIFIELRSPLKDKLGYEGALISKLRTPDPYKAKGIHFKGRTIKTKIGKKS